MYQNSTIPPHLTEILSSFGMDPTALVEPYGSGHINETFVVKNAKNGDVDYLLQRINHHIFKDVPVLMENISRVTAHLRKKLEPVPGSRTDLEVLTLVPTKEKQFYCLDRAGNYWRMYHFLKTNSYDILQTQQQAYEGGKAFGKFQALLVDLDIKLIAETIPDFHQINIRLDRFTKALEKDVALRVKEAGPEIDFVQERMGTMKEVLANFKALGIPLRIIHNDTKFNNVLLDENDHAQCVIDLDTVMPGYVAYDFGDAIRTIINTAAEDEADLDKINLNIPLFKSYAQGYFKEAAGFLTDIETESLLNGVFLITYEQIVRFLTDYLEGDVYYKIHFPLHNLQRTRAQIQLLKKLEAVKETLTEILKNSTKEIGCSN